MNKIILALFTSFFSVAASAQGIPTYDNMNMLNMVKALTNDATKIKALADQVRYWEQQMQMVSGTRGMGVLAVVGASKGLPDSWDTILQQVQNSAGAYSGLVQSVAGKNAVLSGSQLANMTQEQRTLLMRIRNLGATQKVIADTTLDVAGKQMNEIQVLTSRIDTATDPKAIADLNAALNAKKLELENTRIKLFAMDQQAQAEQKFIAMQQFELEKQRTGTPATRTIHIDP